ncbi:hemerythrin domain-containing protein [Streptomyces sp. CT34]|uniref:hemerythrin domain-containing protein n=1 Tax=Streptomyces sp. CT34 TaxID=1553907 RepID=UPI0005BD6AE5|nr:hemerythrin domain-containing protein [Streptomyces sp. CT34]
MEHGKDVIKDVISELTADHREVDELFARFGDTPPGSEERKRLADSITIELVRHSVAEEQHFYPAVREHVAGGDVLADRGIAEHGRIEQLLKDLEGRAPADLDFDRLMVKVRTEVRAHVDDEENNLFPRLRESVHPFVLESLGRKVHEAKRTAPTHPHPSSPHTPPANKLLAPGLGLVDRVRDCLTGRGQ